MSDQEDDVLTSLDDGVLTITLNRPESRNSITQRASRLIGEAAYDASRNPGVRVVVVRGAGTNFCSGGNVKGFGSADQDDSIALEWNDHPLWNEIEYKTDRFRHGTETTMLLHTMGKPTIAMVRGPVVGAGVGLAACCDFRIVSETTRYLSGYTRIGLTIDFGTSYYVTKLIGPAKAREFYLLGGELNAEQALAQGLATRVVADESLEDETMAMARKLAEGPPIGHYYIKQNLNAAESMHLREVADIEARNFARAFQTQDLAEGVNALLEKRAAKFTGQ